MTKALASFPEDRRTAIASRRLTNGVNSGARGNGFWAAKDYFLKKGMRLPGKLGTQQLLGEALERMAHGSSFNTEDPTPRDRRHQSNGAPKGDGFGKPPRRKDRTTERRSDRRRDKHGVAMPAMRDRSAGLGGRKAPHGRSSHAHTNKPRVIRSR